MPKTIRTRSSAEVFQSSSLSGHATPEAAFINNLLSAAITYTTNTVLGSVFKDSNIALPQVSSTQSALLLDIGISSDPGLFPSTAIAQSTSITAAIDQQIEQANEATNDVLEEEITKIQEECSAREAALIQEYEARIKILEEDCDEKNYGLPEEDVRNIYECFVSAYVDKGPYHLPSMEKFHKYYTILDDKLKEQETEDFRLKLYRDMLTSLVQNRTVFFENIKLNSEVAALRNYRDEAKYKILDLTKQLAEFHSETGNSFFQGTVGIKLKKPKRLIYAQALLNINMAWYIYLHESSKIEAEKYISTVAYVNQIGPDAYKTLVELLDEKYACLEDFLDEVEEKLNIESNEPSCKETCSGSETPSCKDTDANSCSGNDISSCDDNADTCNDVPSCDITNPLSDQNFTSESEECCTDDDTGNNNALVHAICNGQKALMLGGHMSISLSSKVVPSLPSCGTRSRRQRRNRRTSTSKCCRVEPEPCVYTNCHGGGRALMLGGGISMNLNQKFNDKGSSCGKSRKIRTQSKYTTRSARNS